MSLLVVFRDNQIGRRCNSAAAIDRTWGTAASDVMASLDVLAASADFDAYIDLPNVSHEGGHTVFKGSSADVVLDLRPVKGPPPAVEVGHIDVRGRSRPE
jgi:hypothetical protein